MPQPYPLSVTFDGTSPLLDRTIDFQNQSGWIRNEYNISVIDENGESVTGTVTGSVGLEAYSPFADRPETAQEAVDLSTGCRKFTLFFATIGRAVFTVTNLATNQRVVVTAIRGAP